VRLEEIALAISANRRGVVSFEVDRAIGFPQQVENAAEVLHPGKSLGSLVPIRRTLLHLASADVKERLAFPELGQRPHGLDELRGRGADAISADREAQSGSARRCDGGGDDPGIQRVGLVDDRRRGRVRLVPQAGRQEADRLVRHLDVVDNTALPNSVGLRLYRKYGFNHRMTALSPAARDMVDAPADQWEPMDYLQFIYNIFPSSGLVVAGQMVALTRLDPGPTPNRSSFRFTSYSWTPIDDDDARAGADMLNEFLFNVVLNEDFSTAARTQVNLETGLLDQLLVGRNEPAIANAHASYDAVLNASDCLSPARPCS
jgi:hypothetical protein